MINPRVLSIQSTVVHGFCGNKAATFPLQLFGFDVCPINTVQFSNHTGYKSFKGSRLSADQFRELIIGLKENELDCFDYVITGYVGNQPVLYEIRKEMKRMKHKNNQIFIAIDPVMGDNGKLYVDPLCVVEYQEMVTMANLLTPNAFEAEQLTGIKLNSMDSVYKSIYKLHSMGAKAVVLTSVDGKIIGKNDTILVVASDILHPGYFLIIEILRLQMASGWFVGTGDLFMSLLLGWLVKRRASLFESVEKTVSTIQGILCATLKRAEKGVEVGSDSTSRRELALLSDVKLLLDPVLNFKSKNVIKYSGSENSKFDFNEAAPHTKL